jgi:uncharacterized protein YdeI (YjbR/CyaY-like superfamily)
MTRITDLPEAPSPNGREVITPLTAEAWRAWLLRHARRTDGVWVVHRKKSSALQGPTYDDLLDEALCHGWIDSQSRRVDDDRKIQWFSPRRPGGLWSARNKQHLERLVREGRMTPAGQAAIDRAKADGSWSQTDEIDALIVPADLAAALADDARAQAAYDAMSDSAKKQYLWWVHSAKRPRTRAARIAETIRRLSSGESPS